MPAEFKEQLGEQVEEGFVLRPGLHATCLELYTRKDWDEVQDQLRAAFSQFKAKQEAVLRKYNAGARFVKLDGSGRLQIPKDLIDKGALVKDLVRRWKSGIRTSTNSPSTSLTMRSSSTC